ncbi:hypothetical protein Misp02_05700 [Microtetraspora sp. NBRC 16547]|nr:hypothetical protein Misp02_05700 [Microtetraspora sp. NBRC 16547]
MEPVAWRTSSGIARVEKESPTTDKVCTLRKTLKFRFLQSGRGCSPAASLANGSPSAGLPLGPRRIHTPGPARGPHNISSLPGEAGDRAVPDYRLSAVMA